MSEQCPKCGAAEDDRDHQAHGVVEVFFGCGSSLAEGPEEPPFFSETRECVRNQLETADNQLAAARHLVADLLLAAMDGNEPAEDVKREALEFTR